MKVEVFWLIGGQVMTDEYESERTSVQRFGDAALVRLLDKNRREQGLAFYANAPRVRRGSAITAETAEGDQPK